MRVALFGGSFNPPHVAHQLVALHVLETRDVDAIWFVPAFVHPFNKPLEPFADRFRMCELAAAALGPRAYVSDIEARLGGPSRTLPTVQKLMDENRGVAFSLVIGSDLVTETDSWYRGAELRELVPFIVVNRGGRPGVELHAQHASLSLTMPALSSTEIRAALRDGRSVAGVIPKSVLDYITPRGLYGSRQSHEHSDSSHEET